MNAEFSGMLVGVRVRMEDQKREYGLECITGLRSMHREEQRFVASFTVALLLFALILLLVDPIDSVLVAIS